MYNNFGIVTKVEINILSVLQPNELRISIVFVCVQNSRVFNYQYVLHITATEYVYIYKINNL